MRAQYNVEFMLILKPKLRTKKKIKINLNLLYSGGTLFARFVSLSLAQSLPLFIRCFSLSLFDSPVFFHSHAVTRLCANKERLHIK